MPEPRPLDACLESADSLSQVLTHARLLTRIQRIIESELPPPLDAACRIANLRQSVLVIHADSGAVAAKLRQLGARLCRKLLSQGIDCTEITVRVQAGGTPRPTPQVTPRALSRGARTKLEELRDRLSPSEPLALRIDQLLAKAVRAEGE